MKGYPSLEDPADALSVHYGSLYLLGRMRESELVVDQGAAGKRSITEIQRALLGCDDYVAKNHVASLLGTLRGLLGDLPRHQYGMRERADEIFALQTPDAHRCFPLLVASALGKNCSPKSKGWVTRLSLA